METLDSPAQNLEPIDPYPGVSERFKALFTDQMLIFPMSLFMASAFESVQVTPQIRSIAFWSMLILYDPLMTWLAGGTIGHYVMGIRVRSLDDEAQKISFPRAMIRFIVKALLGIISLATVNSTSKSLALHDQAAGSVVVNRKYLKQKGW